MPINEQIKLINTIGQSIWYDNLSRDVLKSGELKSLIELGVSGLTSNPTIFKKAIANSSTYDQAITQLAAQGKSAADIAEDLMVEDVASAADLLMPVFEATKSADGFASIEVSPALAHDTAGTVQAARRLWQKLNRANILIKVPATKEGLPAIQSLLEEGINVNVTLIFSKGDYDSVAETYIKALETRLARGYKLQDVTSVASFFVSRVDTIVEKAYAALVEEGKAKAEDQTAFLGKVGVANSKLAYQSYLRILGGQKFSRLKTQGAKVQRPLWASTSTKNPKLGTLLYVEELIGPDTVNTIPPQTLKALLQGAKIERKIDTELKQAKSLIQQLDALGLQLDKLCKELLLQGVKLFQDSYEELIQGIELKLKGAAAQK